MFCVKCGKELKDDAKFCPYCGAEVRSNLDNDNNNEFQLKKEEIVTLEPLANETNNIGTLEILLLAASVFIIIFSIINLGLIFSVIFLALNVALSILGIILYKKLKSKYDFLIFALNIAFVLYNIGIVTYMLALK